VTPVLSTVGGRLLDLNDLVAEDIDLKVIAHNLANTPRWAGQTPRPLSVAEHSVLASRCARPRHAAEALLHDAAEAYIGDVISPVKHMPGMSAYRRLEECVDRAIHERFGLPPEMARAVKSLDSRMLRAEIEQLLPPGRYEFAPRVRPLDVAIECWPPRRAEREFRRAAEELGLAP
jgi:5'-deoxynucleotidase YfbR-like HD superfamily hydrolase